MSAALRSPALTPQAAPARPRRLRSLLANTLHAPVFELRAGKPTVLEPVEIQADGQTVEPLRAACAGDVAMAFQQLLEKHPHFRGRGRLVFSDFCDGALRLSGCLPSFYLKQQIQALAHRTPGVSRVINRIEVRDSVCRDAELDTWRVE